MPRRYIGVAKKTTFARKNLGQPVKRLEPRFARRLLDQQQSSELPGRQPQQQRPDEPQQQHRVSARGFASQLTGRVENDSATEQRADLFAHSRVRDE